MRTGPRGQLPPAATLTARALRAGRRRAPAAVVPSEPRPSAAAAAVSHGAAAAACKPGAGPRRAAVLRGNTRDEYRPVRLLSRRGRVRSARTSRPGKCPGRCCRQGACPGPMRRAVDRQRAAALGLAAGGIPPGYGPAHRPRLGAAALGPRALAAGSSGGTVRTSCMTEE